MTLISLLADHTNLTARQAAQELGWPVSTTHRLLRRLAAAEFATQKGPGQFAPGMELYRISGRLSRTLPYGEIARPLLQSLSTRFGESSQVTILERKELSMYTAWAEAPPDPMRYDIELNRRYPLVWGASGRANLAYLTEDEVERAIATCREPDVIGRPLDPAELRASLKRIVETGYATVSSQRMRHAVGIAVPFFDSENQPVGSVAFQLPEFRYDEARLPEFVNALKQTASVISQRTGGLMPA